MLDAWIRIARTEATVCTGKVELGRHRHALAQIAARSSTCAGAPDMIPETPRKAQRRHQLGSQSIETAAWPLRLAGAEVRGSSSTSAKRLGVEASGLASPTASSARPMAQSDYGELATTPTSIASQSQPKRRRPTHRRQVDRRSTSRPR